MNQKQEPLPKAYNPQENEADIYATWVKSEYFNPDKLPNLSADAEAFTIVLPPPNVTGTLHIGHAAMLAIEDAMVRFARMRGKRALWIPGTDHAAIATQTKVEKLLMEERGIKDPRRELGRETFLEEVNAFAQTSHDTIVNQLKRMGASVDWSREAYTLDEPRNLAVRAAFKQMYSDGLIYRGHRVVNWCPRCKSTLADDEVEHKETKATLYTFKYSKDFPIAIATTRPETKVGDTAVAVHPSDERYKDLIGQEFDVHFLGVDLHIKIVADESLDPAFGTGVLGVTPGHSQIDAEIAQRHDLPMAQVIGEDGVMTNAAGELAGLDVGEARKKAAELIADQGLLIEEPQEVNQNLSVCYRCASPVEPLPKLQWFIDVNKEFSFRASEYAPMQGVKDGEMVTLKSLMQTAVKSSDIKILPERFEKTYFHWIDNLRDWNISRQIWFGHRVPVWYRGEEIAVGEAPEGSDWIQDEDTLDTWFSSGLWTFSTLGWPNKDAKDLQIFHPTSVLETGYDILFFWVARMILMSTYLLGEVPFKTVYLHGLVRDEQGRKMSKSLGNSIDPIDMIEAYGADATRLSLLIGSTPGNDTKLSEEKIAGFRNFTNKLWNISRFVFMTAGDVRHISEMPAPQTLADRWILGRLSQVVASVTADFEAYEFSRLGETLRDFTWGEFADWYVEIAKTQPSQTTNDILLYVLERLLALWHPFMPYVTERIYREFNADDLLMVAAWPKVDAELAKEDAERFGALKDLITFVRNTRSRYTISYANRLTLLVDGIDLDDAERAVLVELGRLSDIATMSTVPKGAATFAGTFGRAAIELEGIVDIVAEKKKLEAQLAEKSSHLAGIEAKLANKGYIEGAPAAVVAETREKLEQTKAMIAALQSDLESLS